MERFGYDLLEADVEKAMGSVYFMLREDVRSELGMFREDVPPPPDRCTAKDAEAHAKNMTAWQNSLCKLKRWTEVWQLDEYLMSPIRLEELTEA